MSRRRMVVVCLVASQMPVWAEVFNQELLLEPKAREITRLRVQAVAEHVRSLRDER